MNELKNRKDEQARLFLKRIQETIKPFIKEKEMYARSKEKDKLMKAAIAGYKQHKYESMKVYKDKCIKIKIKDNKYNKVLDTSTVYVGVMLVDGVISTYIKDAGEKFYSGDDYKKLEIIYVIEDCE